MSGFHIVPAQPVWRDHAPFNDEYDDPYFSRAGGYDESRYVFLGGNNLPEAWSGCDQWVIAETGFGTGLNFLVTCEAWLATAPSTATLTYYSVEKHPFNPEDLRYAHEAWPQLKPLAGVLQQHYPPLIAGYHGLSLFDGRVRLVLMFGEVLEMLQAMRARVDCWYLDGFAPAKNAAMWSPAVCHEMARMTRAGGSVATYSAASVVRRNLSDAGFAVAKKPGFGRKREMLAAVLAATASPRWAQPWYEAGPSVTAVRSTAVIGAGIAGIASAVCLAQRGIEVTLLERAPEVAVRASGNPAAVVMPLLAANANLESRFYLAAFLRAVQWLNRFSADQPSLDWHGSGVLQLCGPERKAQLAKLGLPERVMRPVSRDEAERLCGIHLDSGGVWFPEGGWLDPGQLCRYLASHTPGITLRCGADVAGLEAGEDNWRIRDRDNTLLAEADTVIVTTGMAASQFEQLDSLPLAPLRGQVSLFKFAEPDIPLRVPVCGDGYVIPTHHDCCCVGATFEPGSRDERVSADDHRFNEAMLAGLLPALACREVQLIGGRAAIRAVTPDRLPVVGPVPDWVDFRQRYRDLHHGRPVARYSPGRYQSGLYVSLGHGSRGMISAWLAGEMLADQICGMAPRFPDGLYRGVHPARFLVRQLRRRQA